MVQGFRVFGFKVTCWRYLQLPNCQTDPAVPAVHDPRQEKQERVTHIEEYVNKYNNDKDSNP